MRSFTLSCTALILIMLLSNAAPSDARKKNHRPNFPQEVAMDDSSVISDTAHEFTASQDCRGDVCAAQVQVVFMPFGCEGTSDNPHKSRFAEDRGRWEITGKSQTKCEQMIKRVTAANQLYRNHLVYWGAEGTPGFKSKQDSKYVEAVAVTACNNDLYLVAATHTLNGYNNKQYFGASGKSAAVTC